MDELAQCYNVLPQLDINNTIDHRPEGDEKWFLANEKTVTQFCRKLAAERPLKDIRDEYNYPKKKGIKDECSRLLEASTMKSRRGFAIQRLMNAMRQFFFSSRRRHTSCLSDWSSDVCSSDLNRANAQSALVLGQARGVAICACAQAGLPVAEYAAAQVKVAIAGNGRAEKEQVQHMVKVQIGRASCRERV